MRRKKHLQKKAKSKKKLRKKKVSRPRPIEDDDEEEEIATSEIEFDLDTNWTTKRIAAAKILEWIEKGAESSFGLQDIEEVRERFGKTARFKEEKLDEIYDHFDPILKSIRVKLRKLCQMDTDDLE